MTSGFLAVRLYKTEVDPLAGASVKALIVPRDLTGEPLRRGSTAAVTASAVSVYFFVYALVAYPLVLYYLCEDYRTDLKLCTLDFSIRYSHVSKKDQSIEKNE